MQNFVRLRSLITLLGNHTSIFGGAQLNLSHHRPASLSTECVVFSDDGSTIVCWHPEQAFPYECSRPLPEPVSESNSVLNIEDQANAYAVFRKKSDEVVRQELMKITHTTKHRWFPRSRDKFAKKTPSDREYL